MPVHNILAQSRILVRDILAQSIPEYKTPAYVYVVMPPGRCHQAGRGAGAGKWADIENTDQIKEE